LGIEEKGSSDDAVAIGEAHRAAVQPAHIQENVCQQLAQGWAGCGAHNAVGRLGESGHGVEIYEEREVGGEFEAVSSYKKHSISRI